MPDSYTQPTGQVNLCVLVVRGQVNIGHVLLGRGGRIDCLDRQIRYVTSDFRVFALAFLIDSGSMPRFYLLYTGN